MITFPRKAERERFDFEHQPRCKYTFMKFRRAKGWPRSQLNGLIVFFSIDYSQAAPKELDETNNLRSAGCGCGVCPKPRPLPSLKRIRLRPVNQQHSAQRVRPASLATRQLRLASFNSGSAAPTHPTVLDATNAIVPKRPMSTRLIITAL
jgi:hypothetical protein